MSDGMATFPLSPMAGEGKETSPLPSPLQEEGVNCVGCSGTLPRNDKFSSRFTLHSSLKKRAAFTLAEGATHVAHSHNIRRAAFTLAEVLITLGIIGVVAALTMPVLISNYRKQVTETKLKQTYSILSNATSKLISETGIPFSSYYVITMHNDVCPSTATHLEECADSLYEDVIKSNNIKIINEYDHSYPLWYSTLISNAVNDEGAIAAVYHGKWFTLPNGCSVGIYNGSFSVITDNLSENRKVELIGGKNYFQFQPANIDNQNTIKEILPGLAPMTQTERKRYNTRADLINACKSNELGGVVNIACSQLFIEDGLRFSDDYPIKF